MRCCLPIRRARSDAKEWLFAALNSVEAASLPWSLLVFTGESHDTAAWKMFDGFLKVHRLQRMEPVLAGREWLAGSFSVADILMADVLRLVDRFDGLANYPACRDYVARATARPGFQEGLRRPDGAFCQGGCGLKFPCSRHQAGTYVNLITSSPIRSLATRRSRGRGPEKNGLPRPNTTGWR